MCVSGGAAITQLWPHPTLRLYECHTEEKVDIDAREFGCLELGHVFGQRLGNMVLVWGQGQDTENDRSWPVLRVIMP